jgi:hypothetical protein
MFKWMFNPINKIELGSAEKKQIRTHFNQGFIDKLNKKWKYNQKMGDCMWKYKFDKKCRNNTLTQLSVHHDHYDIESPYQLTYFKDLDWKICVPKISAEARNVSLHNFSVFKDQILINQHNPLYNNKLRDIQIPPPKKDRNDEVRANLIHGLQNLATETSDLNDACSQTLEYIKTFKELSIIEWTYKDPLDSLKWQFKLKAREIRATQDKKCKLKSAEQLKFLRSAENYKKENKHWKKITNEERGMLQKMSTNSFKNELRYDSVKNVIKREIWKLAMKDLNGIRNPIKAKCAKQILFYYKFGSTNKRKRRTISIK